MVDGVYQGTATKGPVKAVVELTVNGSRIDEIKLIHHRRWRGGIAEKTIPQRIVAAQSTRVDAVTGATISSVAIMQAVQNAVSKAAAAVGDPSR
jgi:fumarate reductase flavoprotein subunit